MKNFILWIFKGVHAAWDEKRVWGALYLFLAMVYFLAAGTDTGIFLVLILTGLALYTGTIIGDRTPLGQGIGSLGLIGDLITNKINQTDPVRVTGNVALLAGILGVILALARVFELHAEMLAIVTGMGVTFFGIAIKTDHANSGKGAP